MNSARCGGGQVSGAGQSVESDAVVAVLSGHELVGKSVPAGPDHDCRLITKPHDGCGCTRIVVGCTGCDWLTEADGTQGDAHRAHVAAEIMGVRRG